MRFDTIIKNGTVVTATDTFVSDVGISGGKITDLAASLPAENASKVIDATGRLVLPGLAGRIETVAGIGTVVVEDPLRCVVRGAAEILERGPQHRHAGPGLRELMSPGADPDPVVVAVLLVVAYS